MDEPRFTNIWLRTTKPTKPYILITDLRRFFNLRSNINLINDPQKKKKTPDGSEVQPRQRTLPSVVLCPMPQYRDTASSSTADVAAYYCERHDSTMRVIKVLFQVAITAGYSTSTAECVFSARARIDTPSRRRLTPITL